MKRRTDFIFWGGALATAGVLLSWVPAVVHRCFDPDEFEHSHAAWCVSKGMLPYQDFFEHHTPWYYVLLRPFFHGFDVAGSVDSARHFLLFGRGLSLVLSALSVFLLGRIGGLWSERRVGLLAGLMLVGQPMFAEKAIEIRPDVLALPLFLGGLWFLLRGLARGAASTGWSLRHSFVAGLGLGAAVMCTQKMLFVFPGLLAGLMLWCVGGSAPLATMQARARARLPMLLMLLAGVCVPFAATWAGFAWYGAGGAFIRNNFILNAHWKPVETGQGHKLIATSWPVLTLGLLGAVVSSMRLLRAREGRSGSLVLLCTVLGLFAGLLIMPSAHSQYYLMPLPLVCLLAAHGVLFLIDRLRRSVRPALLVLALVVFAQFPARAAREPLECRNDGQLARLRYVFERTRPDDLVMDGWQGMGVFRPHAFYYFFLHREALAMLPHARLAAYLDALDSGRVRPTLIAMDRSLVALGPRFQHFVRQHYATTDGFLYFLNGFWSKHPRGLLREVRGF